MEILDLSMFLERHKDIFAMDSRKMEQKTETESALKSKNTTEKTKR